MNTSCILNSSGKTSSIKAHCMKKWYMQYFLHSQSEESYEENIQWLSCIITQWFSIESIQSLFEIKQLTRSNSFSRQLLSTTSRFQDYGVYNNAKAYGNIRNCNYIRLNTECLKWLFSRIFDNELWKSLLTEWD